VLLSSVEGIRWHDGLDLVLVKDDDGRWVETCADRWMPVAMKKVFFMLSYSYEEGGSFPKLGFG
jgi:hypothetical protein